MPLYSSPTSATDLHRRIGKYGLMLIGVCCGWQLGYGQATFAAYGQSLGVYPDGTTNTVLDGGANCYADCTITGSSLQGNSLFHSFREFSIPDGVTVTFEAGSAANIFTRVSGEYASTLNGTLAVTGNADLFLLNPQGIIFGPDAALALPGSFFASTAQSVLFPNGKQFGTADMSTPLLTVSTPTGLQFGSTAHPIVNRSQVGFNILPNQDVQPAGLQVQPGKTLALLGGQVLLEGGHLTANGGRVELGGVGPNSKVSLTSRRAFGYEQATTFRDVQLTQGSHVDVTGSSSEVFVRSRNFYMTEASSITNYVTGAALPGKISLVSEDAVELGGRSIIFSPHFLSTVTEGSQLEVFSRRFALRGGSTLAGIAWGALGAGANVVINAEDSVELTGASLETPNYITASSIGNGAGGDIEINTRRLLVSDGSQVESVTGGSGQGGDITIRARDRVDVVGRAPTSTAPVSRRILEILRLQFASTAVGPSVSRIVATSGLEEVDSSRVTGPGGSLTISTGTLSVSDGAQVSVGSFNSGDSGDLALSARSVQLDTGAQITAAALASGNGGDIRLNDLEALVLRRGSTVSTSTAIGEGIGDGGNISIDADFVIGLEDADIVAQSTQGRGGNININTLGLYGIAPRMAIAGNGTSDIDASSQFGISGTTAVNQAVTVPTVTPTILAIQALDESTTVTQRCGASGNRFVVTARGGIPMTPTGAIEIHDAVVDLGDAGGDSRVDKLAPGSPVDEVLFRPQAAAANVNKWTEARDWQTDAAGQIVLTAQPSRSASAPFSSAHCSS